MNENYRVIHTADWHIGKKLHQQDRYDEHALFLDFLTQTIVEKQVDALIVSGDIFDTTHPTAQSTKIYYEFLAHLHKVSSCSVVIIAGNHDHPSHLEAPKNIMKAIDVHVIGTLTENYEEALLYLPNRQNPKLVVAAIPFLRDNELRKGDIGQSQEEIQRYLVEGIERRYSECLKCINHPLSLNIPLVATGHLTVLGATKSESEDTIHIGGLGIVSTHIFPDKFSYVALGHLHKPQAVGKKEHIRYSGSPIPLSFSERDDIKEIRYLEFNDSQLVQNEGIKIPVTRKLFQLKTTPADISSCLENFNPGAGLLKHWVEIIFETNEHLPDLHKLALDAAQDKPYEIIKTVLLNNSLSTGLRSSGEDLFLNDLLGNPKEVFLKKLDDSQIEDEEERTDLILAFEELYSIVSHI